MLFFCFWFLSVLLGQLGDNLGFAVDVVLLVVVGLLLAQLDLAAAVLGQQDRVTDLDADRDELAVLHSPQ